MSNLMLLAFYAVLVILVVAGVAIALCKAGSEADKKIEHEADRKGDK